MGKYIMQILSILSKNFELINFTLKFTAQKNRLHKNRNKTLKE